MSKKRKTRKQKEKAITRQVVVSSSNAEPTYTISNKNLSIESKPKIKILKPETLSANTNYLNKDLVSIASATGIVIAFDILLTVLLSSGTLRLNFLGY